MKICTISTGIFAVCPPNGTVGYSGLECIAYHTAKGLAERGHEVSLIAPEGSSCPGVQIIPTGKPGDGDERRSYSRYWQELLKFDVIIDHSWQKSSYLLKQEGRINAPVLGILHAPCHTMYQSPPPVDKPCIICISNDQANHWRALHPLSDARVCYNGIDTEYHKAMNISRSNRFLFLARFSSIKCPDTCIQAARQAKVGLDLIGDTSITNEPEFFQQIQAACDGKQIKMVGPATRGETVWWFSQAHAMLHLAHRYREPFGLAPVEAMACGTPVVAWRFGALPETVNHGQTGFLVKSLEEAVVACNELKDMDAGRLKLMREACREQVLKFTVQKMVQRYEELCIEAIEGGGW